MEAGLVTSECAHQEGEVELVSVAVGVQQREYIVLDIGSAPVPCCELGLPSTAYSQAVKAEESLWMDDFSGTLKVVLRSTACLLESLTAGGLL